MRTLHTIIILSILTTGLGCDMFTPSPTPRPAPPVAATTQPAPAPVTPVTKVAPPVKPPEVEPTIAKKTDNVMAIINGKTITMDQLHHILVDGYGLAIAQNILRTELVSQAAKSKGITITEKEVDQEHERALKLTFAMANSDAERQQMLNQLLTSKNVTYSTWRLIMRRNAILRKMIGTDFEVPDDVVRAKFDKQYGRMVVVRHIETKNHARAKLVKEYAATKDFASLAKEFSSSPTGQTGGLLPAIGPDTTQVSPAIKQVALAMTKIGEISDPVQVSSRFHILKLEKIIAPKKVKYADKKGEIAAALKEQMIRGAGARLLDKLSAAADVEFINPSLKKQAEQRANEKP